MTPTRSSHILSFLLTLSVGFTSCGPGPRAPSPIGVVEMHLSYSWNDTTFALGETYTTAGRAIRVSGLSFFLSHPQLKRGDSVVADFADRYILFDATQTSSNALGSAPAGSFDHVEFFIGLDSAANHADPTLAKPPLDHAGMHWNWNPAQGYKFFILEGGFDDDGDSLEKDDPPFQFHCATDAALRKISLPYAGTVTEGDTIRIELNLRVNELLRGIDIPSRPIGMGYDPANSRVMDNLRGAFAAE